MASIAIMAGGAILNAAAFIGGNYLARALGGGDDAALKEKERHDKALEAYQAAYAKYSRDRTKLLDWIQTNAEIKEQAKQNFTNTDYAFKLYNQAHPDKQMIPPKEPKFSDFYQPSEQQKQGELMFVGAGALALGHVVTHARSARMDAKISKVYYSPQGYWKGIAAIKKLAEAAKVSEDAAKKWLVKQALWQIYLPAPRYVPRPKFDVSSPNAVHQADLLFLPHDKLPRGRKVYKYALTVVDVASRFKEAEPLTSKDSTEVAKGFQTIYRRSALKWPQMLQVDPGREFMGAVTKEMENHKTYIRRGRVNFHRDQAIVERFNQTLAGRLFGYQYGVEMNLPSGQRSTAWVKRLPEVVTALNNEVTSLTGKKPAAAIKEKAVSSKPSSKYTRPVGLKEKKLPSLVNVRYLFQPGELEGGVKRATDPIWSLKVYSIERSVTKPDQPVLYYLHDGPKRGFVREELLIIPPNTQLPPST
ncbi:hypothetical protein ACROYT_G042338 [Oculina patagonica]